MLSFAILLLCAGAIYFSCEFFVNGVEWAACRMRVGQTATGTLLAAFGTALPESAITLVAVAFGSTSASKQIGIGAALGGPLVLSTISYAVVGFMLLLCAKKLGRPDTKLHLNQKRLSEDQGWFLVIFAFKILLGLVIFNGKAGWEFFPGRLRVLYRQGNSPCRRCLRYSRTAKTTARPESSDDSVDCAATARALTVIAIASHFFVHQLSQVGSVLGLSRQLVALLFSPLATELPETMNAIIWLRQGKENLALANISGAMMIQATVPSALGLFFTRWHFDPPLILAGGVTFTQCSYFFFFFRRGRMGGRSLARLGLLYGVFGAGLVALNYI